jgi:hypothetical protein
MEYRDEKLVQVDRLGSKEPDLYDFQCLNYD